CLEVRAVVACRLDAPLVEMALDIRGGKAKARTERGAALKLVGRDVSEPLAEVVNVEGRCAAPGGCVAGRYRQQGRHQQSHGRPRPPRVHAASIRLLYVDLPAVTCHVEGLQVRFFNLRSAASVLRLSTSCACLFTSLRDTSLP